MVAPLSSLADPTATRAGIPEASIFDAHNARTRVATCAPQGDEPKLHVHGAPPQYPPEDIQREGLSLIITSVLTEEYLDREAQQSPARAKRVRKLRDKALANCHAIHAAMISAKAQAVSTDPGDSARGKAMLSGRITDCLNFDLAWRHGLYIELGVGRCGLPVCIAETQAWAWLTQRTQRPPAHAHVTNTCTQHTHTCTHAYPHCTSTLSHSAADAEAYFSAVKADREPPAPSTSAPVVPPPRKAASARAEGFEGFQHMRVDSICLGESDDGPRVCAHCLGESTRPGDGPGGVIAMKKCSACVAVRNTGAGRPPPTRGLYVITQTPVKHSHDRPEECHERRTRDRRRKRPPRTCWPRCAGGRAHAHSPPEPRSP